MRSISFRWDEDFVARIDEARGDVPRSRFVRRAVERALGEPPSRADDEMRPPAPAEQPVSRADAFRRASSLAKRDVRPVPKKG